MGWQRDGSERRFPLSRRGRVFIAWLAAAGAVLGAVAPAGAYIDMPAEKLTLPRLILEFRTIGVYRAERVDLAKGGVRWVLVEHIQGREIPAVKHIIYQYPRIPKNLSSLAVGTLGVLFQDDMYNRSLTFVGGAWYVSTGEADGWWRICYTEDHFDFRCGFAGTHEQLVAACKALLAGREVLVPCRIRRKDPATEWVRCSLRDPHARPVATAPGHGATTAPVVEPYGTDRSLAELTRALHDPNDNLAIASAVEIARRGTLGAPATSELAAVARNRRADPLLRRTCAAAMGRIGPPAAGAVDDLLAVAFNGYGDAKALAGYEAYVALTRIDPGGEVLTARLRQMLGHAEPNVRKQAAEAACMFGPTVRGLADALAVAARDDRDVWVRDSSVRALGQIDPPAEVAVDVLAGALSDENKHVRRNAALSLQRLGSIAAGAVESLTRRLRSEKEREVRIEVIRALGQIGPAAASAIDALSDAVRDSSDSVAYEAREALKRIRKKPAALRQPARR